MKTATAQNSTPTTGTGPLPGPSGLGQFAFRDGVWYLTPVVSAPRAKA
jgi:hypothetical protein